MPLLTSSAMANDQGRSEKIPADLVHSPYAPPFFFILFYDLLDFFVSPQGLFLALCIPPPSHFNDCLNFKDMRSLAGPLSSALVGL